MLRRALFTFVLTTLVIPLNLSAQDFDPPGFYPRYSSGSIEGYGAVITEIPGENSDKIGFRAVHLTPTDEKGLFVTGFDEDGDGWNFVYVCERQRECSGFRVSKQGQIFVVEMNEAYPADGDELAEALKGIRILDRALVEALSNPKVVKLP